MGHANFLRVFYNSSGIFRYFEEAGFSINLNIFSGIFRYFEEAGFLQ